MVIAVDIRFTDAYQHFIFETFKRITAQYPQHTFLFIFDKPFNSSFIFFENVITEIIKQTRIQLLSKLSNENKIFSLLKKYKADVFITGQPIKTNVSQCFIAYDKVMASWIKKAKVVVSNSTYSKKEMAERFKINENKIDIVCYGIDEILKPITSDEREKIKEQYADGNEYFLLSGTIESNTLLNLLKAFSVFKKIQKSNMQLLITSTVDNVFLEKLRLFKYQSEVKVLENIHKKSLHSIVASAYAFVYPSRERYWYPLEAIKCGVPVITDAKAPTEIYGDAALYMNIDNHKNIADKMMLVYKDEKLRSSLIDKGKNQVKKYSWENIANALWKSIEKCLS